MFMCRRSIYPILILLVGLTFLLATACGDDDMPCTDCPGDDNIITGTYDPQPYTLDIPDWLPEPIIPADNPLTKAGVELGRRLFFDPIISVDSTLSCSSCHHPELAFTDALGTSTGVMGLNGRRSAMSLVNLAFNPRGFFWDGRAENLEKQAIEPVLDHVELADTWENVEDKLRQHPDYPQRFKAAFGIDTKAEITRLLATKAIAQFERTLISGRNKFDLALYLNQGFLTDQEERGRELFFIEFAIDQNHPGCSHCHFAPLYTDNQFKNNGIEDVDGLQDFPDEGHGEVTNNIYDNGTFRVPTLRNVMQTAPYMHDGRFTTLEEVIDHYASGGHNVENKDPNSRPFTILPEDKAALIAFLKTLSDEEFLTNPAFSSPF